MLDSPSWILDPITLASGRRKWSSLARNGVTSNIQLPNSIGDDVLRIFSASARGAATTPCIETLDVSGNGLTNRSAEILRVGERMKQTLGLRRLALRSNMISDQGAELLARAIASPGPLSSVESLLLGSNPDMTARTAELFLQVILAAPKLKQLDLQGVALNRAGAESLAKCLRARTQGSSSSWTIEADAIAVITVSSPWRPTRGSPGSDWGPFVSQIGGSPSSPGQLGRKVAVQRIQNSSPEQAQQQTTVAGAAIN